MGVFRKFMARSSNREKKPRFGDIMATGEGFSLFFLPTEEVWTDLTPLLWTYMATVRCCFACIVV